MRASKQGRAGQGTAQHAKEYMIFVQVPKRVRRRNGWVASPHGGDPVGGELVRLRSVVKPGRKSGLDCGHFWQARLVVRKG
jgi:hypothetical protein